jgi:hypothetical protein
MDLTIPRPLATSLPAGWPDLGLDESDIRWHLDGGAPWPTSQRAVDLTIAALPQIDDPLALALIIELLETIVDVRERGQSFERLMSTGLADWHKRARAEQRRRRMRTVRR